MGYTLHFIPHTHWDREWYMSFEDHRFRLVEFMDTLLETLHNDLNYKSFHLDGQIILLDDYLEIKPQKLEEIRKYVMEGRLQIGPWYVLQDEFLTSGEANIRNLLYGIRFAEKYGDVCKVGYFPDAFGSFSQIPQILKDFDIKRVVIGRGVNPFEEGKYKSEFLWKSPDGSIVTTVFLAGWYNNASEIPVDSIKAKEFIMKAYDNAVTYSNTSNLLMMNGCDHQPLQKNLPLILENMRCEFGEDILLQSNFNSFFDSLEPFHSRLNSAEGELTGQKSSGLFTLVNTASSRIYLKQMNYQAQTLLEKWAEPLGSIAWIMGDTYRSDFFKKAWIYLLQNHPHDSICGCSIDEVHKEMVVRFNKSIAISNNLIEREFNYIAQNIDTSNANKGDIPIVVFNPLAWNVTEQITAIVDVDENYEIDIKNLKVVDYEGNSIISDITSCDRVFAIELPEDSFRKAKYVKRLQLKFIAENIPAVGYKTFYISKVAEKKANCLKFGDYFAENEYLKLDIEKDGTLCLVDKITGVSYSGLNIFEDIGDKGDSYNFIMIDDDKSITTEGGQAKIKICGSGEGFVTFEVIHEMLLPKCINKNMKSRSKRYTKFKIVSYIHMTSVSKRVDVTTVFDNNLTNHRIRALFRSNIVTEYHSADSQFDVVQRKIEPDILWKNPSNCQRQQAYVEIFNDEKGIMIANRGLPEYEILRDGQNTIALTLLRSVGEMGDWGYFPTPDAQCLGKHRLEYSIIPYEGAYKRGRAHKEAYVFNLGALKAIVTGIHTGLYQPKHSFINIGSDNITISAIKLSENGDSLILRAYNHSEGDEEIAFSLGEMFPFIYETSMNEERKKLVETQKGLIQMKVPSKKIISFELISKREGG